jgi:hypothetical protein
VLRKTITLSMSVAGLAGLALPAAAQDLCGGAGANGQWIGGSEAASDVSTSGSYMEQMALVLMGNEYVALFNVSAPTDVRVEASGRGGGDPVIDLRDAFGNIILSDDDSGGSGASRGEMFLDAGTYCLSMASFDGAPMTGFVRVGRLEQEALTEGMGSEPMPFDGGEDMVSGDVCANLTNFLDDGFPLDANLMGGVTATASVFEVGAWGFTLGTPQAITITADNESADPLIVLFDAFGGYLGENDDFDGLNSRIDFTSPLPAGDYCLQMSALSDESQPITVTVTSFDPAAQVVSLYESGEAAPPMDGSYPITPLGPLGNRVRQDLQISEITTWMSFDIDAPGLIVVEAVSNGIGDPVMVLYDDFGRMVAENDDYGASLDPLIAARVLPGTYLVGVRQLNQGETGLVRLLFERYIPAP